MAFTSILALLLPLVRSLPLLSRSADISDTDILNYALTLEHLEYAFYTAGLAAYDDAAFNSSGFSSDIRGYFTQIAAHEAGHVTFLTAAIGEGAVQACDYNFTYTDPKSFAALAQVLEGVGVSAYAGAAHYLSNKAYLTAAAVVLSTEARHNAWLSAVVEAQAPWSGPLDTPLQLDSVYTLAAPFITSCPAENAALPLVAYPPLTIDSNLSTYSFANSTNQTDVQIVLYTGLTQDVVNASDGKLTLPEGLQGTVYAIAKGSNGNIVAGPAILTFPVEDVTGNSSNSETVDGSSSAAMRIHVGATLGGVVMLAVVALFL